MEICKKIKENYLSVTSILTIITTLLYFILRDTFSDLSLRTYSYIFESTEHLFLVLFFISFIVLIVLNIRLMYKTFFYENTIKSISTELKSFKEAIQEASHINDKLWSCEIRNSRDNRLKKNQRNTRYISIVNLKGGVGKTTLAANLAAALGIKSDKQILLVDLDFQHSLTNRCIDANAYEKLYYQSYSLDNKTSVSLLNENTLCEEILENKIFINNLSKVHIIPSHEKLHAKDIEKQIEFILPNDKEVRLLHSKIFHHTMITSLYNYVIFDCPPRLTTSSVNAIFCSDYYVIPTKLGPDSTDAVMRTFEWIKKMEAICDIKLLGVVPNEVQMRSGSLIKNLQSDYDSLKNRLSNVSENNRNLLFETKITKNNDIATKEAGIVPYVDDKINGSVRENFNKVMKEFIDRIKHYEDQTFCQTY